MKYNPAIVVAYFRECGLPVPQMEFKFCEWRQWRFDFAWPSYTKHYSHPVALEVDGGIWIRGGHNRGAQIKKTWEKENRAQIMGWRIIKCEPKDLCTEDTAKLIKEALGI